MAMGMGSGAGPREGALAEWLDDSALRSPIIHDCDPELIQDQWTYEGENNQRRYYDPCTPQRRSSATASPTPLGRAATSIQF